MVSPPAPGAARQSFQALLATAQTEVPDWKQITLRLDGGTGGRGGAAAPAGTAGRGGARGGEGAGRGGRGNAVNAGAPAAAQPAAARPAGPAPVSAVVRETHSWPRTANTTLSLDPYTGKVLTRTGYAQMATGQQVRAWTRFLHTGEALGPVGQFVAGLACLGGCFLVYTGFALSCRRFFGKRPKPPTAAAAVREPALAEAARE
jgi:hypothetical protein